MSKRSRTAGLLFLAASSVYAIQALAAKPSSAVSQPPAPTPATARSTPAGDAAWATASAAPAENRGTNVKVLEAPPLEPSTSPGKPTGPATAKPAAGAATANDPFANSTETRPADDGSQGTSVTADMVSVNDAGTVEIHVNDAALVEVLRMLSLQSQKNIVASKEVGGKVTANLYGVTVREALDAILHANGFAYREKGNFIYVYTAKEIQELEKANRVTTTEVFRLFYTPGANAVNMIKPVLSDAAQVSFSTQAVAGITTGSSDVGGNSHAIEDVVVVTDYPENLERVRKIIKEVDRRPQQILIEATILRAALSEDNALGVDFNVVAGVNLAQIVTNAGGQILGGNFGGENPDATARGAGGIGTGNSFTNGVNGGLKVGFVSDNISVVLAALEGVTDTTVLANPKVLALNKQKGEVIVGRKDGYLTTTVTESSTVQTVEFLDTGTRLIFRPFIGDDGYIRMEIHPEDSSGGLTADNLPFKITTEVTSNIMVKDGHTVVIGGLFREASDSSKSQVPGLGNLPIAGALFRNQRDRTVREEIIILLTPHIIKDEVAFSNASEAELNELDKLRVGVRRGMMPWGRERLAEAAYEKAVAEMAKEYPDKEKALFHLNCATNLNPKFREAINLRESISGKQLSASDNSSVRSFVRRQVIADRDRPAPERLPASVPITVTPQNNGSTVPQPAGLQTSNATDPSTQPATQPTKLLVAAPASPHDPSAVQVENPSNVPAVNWMDWLRTATTAAARPGSVSGSPSTQPSTPVEPALTELPMDPVEPDDHRPE